MFLREPTKSLFERALTLADDGDALCAEYKFGAAVGVYDAALGAAYDARAAYGSSVPSSFQEHLKSTYQDLITRLVHTKTRAWHHMAYVVGPWQRDEQLDGERCLTRSASGRGWTRSRASGFARLRRIDVA